MQTQQPYQLRTYAWCWSIPPKCSRYKIQMKTVFKTEVETQQFKLKRQSKPLLLFCTVDNYYKFVFTRWFLRSGLCPPAAQGSPPAQMDPPVFRFAGQDDQICPIFWSDLADSLEKDFYKMVSDWEHLKVSGNKRLWWWRDGCLGLPKLLRMGNLIVAY